MLDQLAIAMATIAFTAVLLVTALFHVDRIHASPVGSGLVSQIAARR